MTVPQSLWDTCLGLCLSQNQVNIHTTKTASMEIYSFWSSQYRDQLHVAKLISNRDWGPTGRWKKPLGNSADKQRWSKIVLVLGGSNSNSARHGVWWKGCCGPNKLSRTPTERPVTKKDIQGYVTKSAASRVRNLTFYSVMVRTHLWVLGPAQAPWCLSYIGADEPEARGDHQAVRDGAQDTWCEKCQSFVLKF